MAPSIEPLEVRLVPTSFNVNVFIDTIDANPGDGIAADSSGTTSLRAAIMEANAHAGADEINLAPGVYTLTIGGTNEDQSATGDLDITEDVLIRSGIGGPTTIQQDLVGGFGLDRVFDILGSANFVSISGVRIQHGNAVGGRGGGIRTARSMELTNVTLADNQTDQDGGGLAVEGVGQASLHQSKVFNNSAFNSGGGVFSQASLQINQTKIADNSAGTTGGGVHSSGSLSLFRSTLSGNSAAIGGGAFLTMTTFRGNGQARIDNSTIDHNSAEQGGGIYSSINLSISSSTLSTNSATQKGAGLYQASGSTDVEFSTIAANVATDGNAGTTEFGGGVFLDAGTLRLRNSLVATNIGNKGPDLARGSSGNSIESLGHNLLGNNNDSGFVAAAADLVGTNAAPINPLIGPLADNGGFTQTHQLNVGSPAIDAGGSPTSFGGSSGGMSATPERDQRLAPRANNGSLDIGAFETGFTGFIVNSSLDLPDANPGDGTADADPGPARVVTLRAAIMEANALGGQQTILLPDGFFQLSLPTGRPDTDANGDLDITDSAGVNVVGVSSLSTSISSLVGSAFHVHSGASLSLGQLQINGVGGTALVNDGGTLTISRSSVAANSSSTGPGGLLNLAGTATIDNSTFSGNSGLSAAGAIHNFGTLNLTNVTITQNQSVNTAGGLVNEINGTANLLNTIVAQNAGDFSSTDLSGAFTGTSHNLVGDLGTATSADFSGSNGNLSGGTVTNSGTFVASDPGVSFSAPLVSTSNHGLSSGDLVLFTTFFGGPPERHLVTVLDSNQFLVQGVSIATGTSGTVSWRRLLDARLESFDGSSLDIFSFSLNSIGSVGTSSLFTPLIGSPAIDNGTSTGAPPVDQYGNSRPQNGGVTSEFDIGAFERTLGAIRGSVFEDSNHNGIRDVSETGVTAGVSLIDTLSGREFPIQTQTDGQFLFEGVRQPGDYLLRVTQSLSTTQSMSTVAAPRPIDFVLDQPVTSGTGLNITSGLIVDLDKDGSPEVIFAGTQTVGATQQAVVLVYKSVGDSDPFAAVPQTIVLPGATSVKTLAAGFFNNDSFGDLAVTTGGSDKLFVLSNDGVGGLSVVFQTATGANPSAIAIGDFNHDSQADIALTNQNSGAVQFALGNGNFGFGSLVTISTGTAPSALLAVTPDSRSAVGSSQPSDSLLVANTGDNSISRVEFNAQGQFVNTMLFNNVPGVNGLASGDFDRDGDVDFAVTGTFGLAIALTTNNSPTPVIDSILRFDGVASGVSAANFNGDQYPDLVVTGENGSLGVVTYFRGLGNGLFARETSDFFADPVRPAIVVASSTSNIPASDFSVSQLPDLLLLTANGSTQFLQRNITGLIPVTVSNAGKVNVDAPILFRGQLSGRVTDSSAAGVANATVYDDVNQNGRFDFNEPSTRTSFDDTFTPGVDEAGFFSLAVAPGDVLLRVSFFAHHATTPSSPSLEPPKQYDSFETLTTMPTAATGDFNGDQLPDLLLGTQSGVGVYLGTATGGFQRVGGINLGAPAQQFAVGDFNHDGHIDLGVSYQGVAIKAYFGTGDGSFVSGFGTSVPNPIMSLVSGDFNKDGNDDLALLMPRSNEIRVFVSDGKTTFTSQTLSTTTTGVNPANVMVAADFDGDGDTDLATASKNSSNGDDQIVIHRSFQNGSSLDFTAQIVTINFRPNFFLRAGDLNGDGAIDLLSGSLSGSAPGPAQVLLNQGNGLAQFSVPKPLSGVAQQGLLIDLDHDSDLDILTTNDSFGDGTSVDFRVSKNDGSGNFSFADQLTLNEQLLPVRFDANHDGRSDLLTAGSDHFSVRIISQGEYSETLVSGGFIGNRDFVIEPVRFDVSGIVFDDRNANGIQDASELGLPNVTVFLDLNLNGRQDAVEPIQTTGAGGEYLFLGIESLKPVAVTMQTLLGYDETQPRLIGKNNFNPQVQFVNSFSTGQNATGNLKSIVLADFNSDGRPDVAVTNKNTNEVAVLLAKADGSLSLPPISVAVQDAPSEVAAGDLNGDQLNDLVVANLGGHSLSVLLNNGAGGFITTHVPISATAVPTEVSLADLDGDGDLDVAVFDGNTNQIRIFRNDGTGSLSAFGTINGGGTLSDLHVSFLDGANDKTRDLIALRSDASEVVIFRNNGNGTFAAPQAVAVGNFPGSLEVADFTNDGFADIITINNDHTATILVRNGGAFVSSTLNFPTGGIFPNLASAHAAFLQGPGDPNLDLVVMGSGDGSNSFALLIGDGLGNFQVNYGGTSAGGTSSGGFSTSGPTIDFATGYNFSGHEVSGRDFSGDGLPDLVVLGSGSVTVAHNTFGTYVIPAGTEGDVGPRNFGTFLADTLVTTNDLGNLVVTGRSGSEQLTVQWNQAQSAFVISDPLNEISTAIPGAIGSNTHSLTIPLSAITGSKVIVRTLGGNDSIKIENTGGLFPFGLILDGGDGNDLIEITGGVTAIDTSAGAPISLTAEEIRLSANLQTDRGSITLEGNVKLQTSVVIDTEFGNDEPSGNVDLSRATVSASAANQNLVIDATSAGPTTGVVTLGKFDSAFGASVHDLTITNAGSGAGTLFTGDVTLSGGLSVTSQSIVVSNNALIAVNGTSTINFSAARDVQLQSGAKLSAVNGDITLHANQQTPASTGQFVGVTIDGATVESTGSGNIELRGFGGNTVDQNFGVLLTNGGKVRSTAAGASAGTITVVGESGGGTQNNVGVRLTGTGTSVKSISGNILIDGTGAGTVDFNHGVQIQSGAVIQSFGTGADAASISILGSGGDGTSFNKGFEILDSGSQVVSSAGNIQITGFGGNGSGSGNLGVSVSHGASLTTGGGTLLLSAAAGGGASLAIGLTGTNTVATGGTGDLTLTGNSIDIGSSTTLRAGSSSNGVLKISPLTSGTAIDLGSATDNAASTLELSDAELDRVFAGTLMIGNANTGPITVSDNVTRTSVTNLNLTTGGNSGIAFSGSTAILDSNNGGVTLTLNSAGTGAITSGGALKDVRGISISLTSGSGGIGVNGNALITDASTLNATTNGNAPMFLAEIDGVTITSAGLSAGTGTISLTGGTFKLGGADRINDNSPLSIAVGAAFALNGFAETFSALSGNGSIINGSATATLLILNAASSLSFSGPLGGNGTNDNNFALTKTGNGTLTLSGTNTFTGDTAVNAGTLLLLGSLTSDVTVASGATLGGTGTINSNNKLTVQSGGTVAPGSSPGILNAGDVLLQSGSALRVELNGTSVGTSYDQVNVTGTVTIASNVALTSSLGFSPSAGDTFVIINNDGSDAISGTFNSLPQGTLFSLGGSKFHIFYNHNGGGDANNNDVALIVNRLPVVNDQAFSISENNGNGAPAGTVSATDADTSVTYSITAGNSLGVFAINSATGEITISDASNLDAESHPSFTLTITVTDDAGAADTANITINLINAAPSTPNDRDTAANSVSEGASNNDLVGIDADSTDIHGGTVTFSLTDDAGGRFAINSSTGVVRVADASQLNFENANSHSITVQASDGAAVSTQSFTITVTNVAPTTPIDGDTAADTVSEGASNNDLVGIDANSNDVHGGTVTFTLTDDAGGRFAINGSTGVVQVADASRLNFENSASHSITVQASDGTNSTTQTFTIAVTNVAPTTPIDGNNTANRVSEGASNNDLVGIDADSIDVHGGTVTFSLTDDAGGRFAIDGSTGVVRVADASLLNFEDATSHTITVKASDGANSTTQNFTIAVKNVAPTRAIDSDTAANSISEGASNNDLVGIDADSSDIHGGTVILSLSDSAGGIFAIDWSTGVVRVADASRLSFETSTSYLITVAAGDGFIYVDQDFTITVTNVAPSSPVDGDSSPNTISEGASNNDLVGIDADSSDVHGGKVTFNLADDAGGRFAIDPLTGVVQVANSSLLNFESGSSHTITVRSYDGSASSTTQSFTIAVTNVAPTTPIDGDNTANSVSEGASNNDLVGIDADSKDVHGGTVTFSLTDDAGGRFAINSLTGVVRVADASLLDFEVSTSHTITVQASDGTATTSQNFTIAVTNVAPTTPIDADTTTNSVSEGAINGDLVGINADSSDVHGGAITFTLTNDAGGRFAIDSRNGVVTVLDVSLLDFSSSNSQTIVVQASDGTASSSQSFTINVFGAAPDAPLDIDDHINTIPEGALEGSRVGITLSATDPQGEDVFYRLTDDAGGRFAIDPFSGVVTVKAGRLLVFNDARQYSFSAVAVDASGNASPAADFVVNVTQVPVDAMPLVSILPTRGIVVEGDSGPNFITFLVKLNKPSAETITVDFSTRLGDDPRFQRPEGISDDTPFATDVPGPWDFFRSAGKLTFDPGVTEQPLRVQIRPDDTPEPNELFFVQLQSPVNVKLAAQQSIAIAKILDDDSAPQLIVSNTQVLEGDSAGKNELVFTVQLIGDLPPGTATATADYFTGNIAIDSAIPGTNYTATSGTLTFTNLDRLQEVHIPILGDTVNESDKTVSLRFENPVNLSLSRPGVIGTIINDDSPNVVVSIAPHVLKLREGNSGSQQAEFIVTLIGKPTGTVSVNYTTTDQTATSGSDYLATSGTVEFTLDDIANGIVQKSVFVTVLGDTRIELDETFSVALTLPETSLPHVSIDPDLAVGKVVIRNDDQAILTEDGDALAVALSGELTAILGNGPKNNPALIAALRARALDIIRTQGLTKAIVIIIDPVDFVLTDTEGRQAGYTASTGVVNEIPGAYYSGDGTVELLIVPLPPDGTYNVQLAGLGGDFNASITVLDRNGTSTDIVSQSLADGATSSVAFQVGGTTIPVGLGLAAANSGASTFGVVGNFGHAEFRLALASVLEEATFDGFEVNDHNSSPSDLMFWLAVSARAVRQRLLDPLWQSLGSPFGDLLNDARLTPRSIPSAFVDQFWSQLGQTLTGVPSSVYRLGDMLEGLIPTLVPGRNRPTTPRPGEQGQPNPTPNNGVRARRSSIERPRTAPNNAQPKPQNKPKTTNDKSTQAPEPKKTDNQQSSTPRTEMFRLASWRTMADGK